MSLHSTMFLLIRHALFGWGIANSPLHSTMFLLIQKPDWSWKTVKSSLHSTMFLLIRNVTGVVGFVNIPLHSTMFLLIPVRGLAKHTDWVSFTFHNVSINTVADELEEIDPKSLHSTMFLLIRYIAEHCSILYETLHSTMFLLIRGYEGWLWDG